MSFEGFARRALVEAAKATGVGLHEATAVRVVAIFSGGKISIAAEVDAFAQRHILSAIKDHPEAAVRAGLASLRAISEEAVVQQGGIPVLGADGRVAEVIGARKGG